MVEDEVDHFDTQTAYMAAKMQTMTKCNVDTYPNMHRMKRGSNSLRALRTEPRR